jgi:hypothetical protein
MYEKTKRQNEFKKKSCVFFLSLKKIYINIYRIFKDDNDYKL